MIVHNVIVRDNRGRIVWEGGVSSTLIAMFRDAMDTLDYVTEEAP